jgi:hypothetical protein
LIDLASIRRLALTQLPLYRQIYSADFSLLDSYRLAKMLLQSEQKPSKQQDVSKAAIEQQNLK